MEESVGFPHYAVHRLRAEAIARIQTGKARMISDKRWDKFGFFQACGPWNW